MRTLGNWVLELVKVIKIDFLLHTLISNSNPYIFATNCGKPLIFETVNSFRSNFLSFKNQKSLNFQVKKIGISKFEFVTKSQFALK